ncbi:MAG: hypothetical protein ACKO3R_01615 [bacterium]
MQISLLNISFLATSSFILLQYLIIPLLNTNYCLQQERLIVEKTENIIHSKRSDLNSITNELKNLNGYRNLNFKDTGLNFTEIDLEVTYTDLLKQERILKHHAQIDLDRY